MFRDKLRDILSLREPIIFPRHGPHPIDVTDIFEQLNLDNSSPRTLAFTPYCTNNCHLDHPSAFPLYTQHIPTTLHTSVLSNAFEQDISLGSQFTVQNWLNAFIDSTKEKFKTRNKTCTICTTSIEYDFFCVPIPPYLHFEIPPTAQSIKPTQILTMATKSGDTQFHLKAVIYYGELHFTATLLLDGQSWNYDSQLNEGIPLLNGNIHEDINDLPGFRNKSAYIYVYEYVS
jgi:hypothetical protein